MKSIMQTEKECYLTGVRGRLHRHHVFYGPYRKSSEKYGLTIWLTPELHNISNRGVHFNKDLDFIVKRLGQIDFEKHLLGTREDFIKIFGRNYLGDEV